MAASLAGDVDGDGLADALVGASGQDTADADGGAVYVLLGGSTGAVSLSVCARIDGLAGAEFLGKALDSAGDVDGVGRADLLLGAFGRTGGAAGAGGVFVVTGVIAY